MQSRIVFVVWMAICVLAIRPAHGQSPDALRKAQAAFDQAQQNYLRGNYEAAAQGFIDAYASRPFPQFLYNVGASFHMKGKKDSDPESYQKAVDAYRRYLTEDPQAADKARVEKAIAVLEAEIKRIKEQPAPAPVATSGNGAGSGASAATPHAPPAPSQEVEQLGDIKVRGLFVIESDPTNATIYLDDKRRGSFATTPWSGLIELSRVS